MSVKGNFWCATILICAKLNPLILPTETAPNNPRLIPLILSSANKPKPITYPLISPAVEIAPIAKPLITDPLISSGRQKR